MALLREGRSSELEPDYWVGAGDRATTQPVSGPTDSIAISDPAAPTQQTPAVINEPILEPDYPVPGPVTPPPDDGNIVNPPPVAGDDGVLPYQPPPPVDPIPYDDGGVEPPRDSDGNIIEPGGQDWSVGSEAEGVSVQDLYPEVPEGSEFDVPDVADPTGAEVTDANLGEGTVETPTDAETDTGQIVDSAVDEVAGTIGSGEQTGLTPEQQVDAELARILGEDSPLLASARAEAMRQMNARGLTNTSMAAGATYSAMVDAALPMAQQNAQQALQREMANTELRQQSNQLTAEQTAALRALEAELGQDLSIFNADQLAQAQRLTAELRSAMESNNAEAYNEAALQLAELQRDAEAQQADLEAAGEEREFLERQAYQEQVLDIVGRLNEQFMIGEQQIDLQHVIGTYQQITSINETAATLMDSYLRSIGSIYDDPKMSTSQAAEAIRQMVTMLEGSMRMLSEMNNMDFGNTDAFIPGGSGGSGDGGGGGGGGRRGGGGGGQQP